MDVETKEMTIDTSSESQPSVPTPTPTPSKKTYKKSTSSIKKEKKSPKADAPSLSVKTNGDDASITTLDENSPRPDDDDDDDLDGDKSPRGKWSAEEDESLKNAVQQHGGRNWKKISDCLEGRTDVQCLHRWQKVLRPGLIKGPWTQEVQLMLLLNSFLMFQLFTGR